jgi:hypothetical protein
MSKIPSIAWSNFALEHDRKKFSESPEFLIQLVQNNWKHRQPGIGRKDLTEVVVVPMKKVSLWMFNNNWTAIRTASRITGHLTRRQPHEDPYVALRGRGKPLSTQCAKVVLYSAATLLKNDGGRSTDADWEIVAIMTGPWTNEPMNPLTMARNFLKKPGGTFAPYTAQQFAESIYFWSQFIQNRK